VSCFIIKYSYIAPAHNESSTCVVIYTKTI
jgi:hypothetical protein